MESFSGLTREPFFIATKKDSRVKPENDSASYAKNFSRRFPFAAA